MGSGTSKAAPVPLLAHQLQRTEQLCLRAARSERRALTRRPAGPASPRAPGLMALPPDWIFHPPIWDGTREGAPQRHLIPISALWDLHHAVTATSPPPAITPAQPRAAALLSVIAPAPASVLARLPGLPQPLPCLKRGAFYSPLAKWPCQSC